MKSISIEKLLYKQDKIIIDIRPNYEYQYGTIPGAINIPSIKLLNNDAVPLMSKHYSTIPNSRKYTSISLSSSARLLSKSLISDITALMSIGSSSSKVST